MSDVSIEVVKLKDHQTTQRSKYHGLAGRLRELPNGEALRIAVSGTTFHSLQCGLRTALKLQDNSLKVRITKASDTEVFVWENRSNAVATGEEQ